ncbi:hypothetical protein A0256_22120 [Mucilaginibacter sp. PAMC 26640]|nr:hypothetical protein A0256_22120 [Mucilaginibacter sp. PAMC 26640]
MATDKKITELPVSANITGADVSILVKDGINYQFSINQLISYLNTSINRGATLTFGTLLPQNTTGKNGDVFFNTTTRQFAQKLTGSWAITYTLPETNAADGTVLYGAGLPGTTTGKNADSYINTLTGIFYLKTSGSWAQVFSMQTGPQGPKGLKGEAGPAGLNGRAILNGTGAPSNLATGADGDFYINTSSLSLFGPKTNGIWGTGISIVGADGAQGDAGPAGPSGAAGVAGAVGPQGLQGPAGPTGTAGAIGPEGPVGLTGAQGSTGLAGAAGADGAAGVAGQPGPAGDTGEQGPSGPIGATGSQGPAGNTGPQGIPGAGIPAGGSTGQVLAKNSNAGYDTQWINPPAGSSRISYNLYQSVL